MKANLTLKQKSNLSQVLKIKERRTIERRNRKECIQPYSFCFGCGKCSKAIYSRKF